MGDYLKRFRALAYDHPWHAYPHYFGLFFLSVSTADWSLQILFGWKLDSFERVAFSAVLALVVQYIDRSRERRSRQV